MTSHERSPAFARMMAAHAGAVAKLARRQAERLVSTGALDTEAVAAWAANFLPVTGETAEWVSTEEGIRRRAAAGDPWALQVLGHWERNPGERPRPNPDWAGR